MLALRVFWWFFCLLRVRYRVTPEWRLVKGAVIAGLGLPVVVGV